MANHFTAPVRISTRGPIELCPAPVADVACPPLAACWRDRKQKLAAFISDSTSQADLCERAFVEIAFASVRLPTGSIRLARKR